MQLSIRKTGIRELPSEEVIMESKLTNDQWVAWSPGVWEISLAHNQEKSGHPAQYPEELCNRIIRMF
ncbi:MAG: site-specific DNA-methyltransferase, partial [Deltaproteobacteria bacterium]|nr:site-specific DNA-methyltransferase [Deltaproteobacteria bacterium]